jgi:hypothetical protein
MLKKCWVFQNQSIKSWWICLYLIPPIEEFGFKPTRKIVLRDNQILVTASIATHPKNS